jgi:hypothetical protein
MSGKELFDYYQQAALTKGFGSAEFQYGNILFEALKLEGESNLFKKLEEANAAGRQLMLAHTKGIYDAEPDIVIMA